MSQKIAPKIVNFAREKYNQSQDLREKLGAVGNRTHPESPVFFDALEQSAIKYGLAGLVFGLPNAIFLYSIERQIQRPKAKLSAIQAIFAGVGHVIRYELVKLEKDIGNGLIRRFVGPALVGLTGLSILNVIDDKHSGYEFKTDIEKYRHNYSNQSGTTGYLPRHFKDEDN